MKINLAKSAGFCFGVKRAIDIALHTAACKKNVYMLGDIVHNEDVVKQIRKSGVKKIDRLSPGKHRILLIRAHGASLKTIQDAERLGYKIVDATCPMVKEIHRIVQDMEHKGYKVIIIGDKKHDEVQGIAGQLKSKAIVVDEIKNIPIKNIKKIKKACVVVQSTQNIEKVNKIVAKLKSYVKELLFFNTICRPTRVRQREIKRMPLENEVMIIIGSKNSANTKRLYEIAKSLNKKTYWVGTKDDIRKVWFKNVKSTGVTAGASTPGRTTQEVITHIKKISS
jgi:4-hydroxy-3-methylbut-2-enyl diphosphate reductase